MYNKSDDQLLVMQDKIEANRKYYNDKMKKLTEDLTSMITSMVDQIKISKSSTDRKDSQKYQYHTTVVLANKRYPPLEDVNYTKVGGMWTLKHEIISPKLYELLIWTELEGETDMNLKNFYNHIKMCLNEVNRI